jgi:hypothetical protein
MCRAFLAVLGGARYGPENGDFVGKCLAGGSIEVGKLEIEYLKITILQEKTYVRPVRGLSKYLRMRPWPFYIRLFACIGL